MDVISALLGLRADAGALDTRFPSSSLLSFLFVDSCKGSIRVLLSGYYKRSSVVPNSPSSV